MLIPMGFLAASGSGAGGAFELISTAYGTGSSGVITFSSISTTTYKHLQLRVVGRGTAANVSDSILMRFNSDTNGNYDRHLLYGNGSSATSTYGTNVTSITLNTAIFNANAAAGIVGVSIVDIVDAFSTSKNKTIRQLTGGTTPDNFIMLGSGQWRSTSAVDTITISAPSGNFSTIARASLYGIKG